VKFAAIAGWADEKTYSVMFMCKQLGVSRSGYYAWRGSTLTQHAKDDITLTAIMKNLHSQGRGNPGVRRLCAGLAASGYRVAHKRVHRLMQAADLQGRHPKAWRRTTTGARDPVAAPDLVARNFTAEHPNEKWCGDITYVKTWDGWAYLATVIDLHSRKIVGWAVADHMRTDLVTAALDMAVTTREPPPGVIFHSDRGAQYTSRAFDEYCRHHNIRRSLGRTGTCYDNAVSESFFATYKKELVHTRPWPTVTDLVDHTHDWIQNYYNSIRRHSTLNYLTPQEYELGLRSLNQIAA
jgi:putative transposase